MKKILHQTQLNELRSTHTSLKEQITGLCKSNVVDSDVFRALMLQRLEIQSNIHALSMEIIPDITA